MLLWRALGTFCLHATRCIHAMGVTLTLTCDLSLFAPLLMAVVWSRVLQKLILRMKVRNTAKVLFSG